VSRSGKVRLDMLLVERGLVASREQGQRLIMAGEVLVDGQPATKPGRRVEPGADVQIKSKPRFASRGGDKLAAALDAFSVQPEGWVCADVGASTGGFTDCLLQAGAARVYAIDVGYGQLDWRLRQDARVVVMERTNARTLERLPEPVDFVSADASFISLRLLLPPIRGWLRAGGMVVALVKPQFEAGRREVSKGGVVRDPAVHRRVLIEVMAAAQGLGFAPLGLIRSPLLGPAGNVEFLLWLGTGGDEGHDPADLADRVLGDAIP
jgi:23S rRNA (cytidine1920-2'-O)/16S rRNA (cytidine1409-2'-O)-methyltransferase